MTQVTRNVASAGATTFWKKGFILTMVVGMLLAASAIGYAASARAPFAVAAPTASYVPNQFIIQVTKGASRAAVDQLVYALNAQVIRALPLPDTYLVKLGRTGPSRYTRSIMGVAPAKCSIVYVEPNCIRLIDAVPNDPDFSKQWNMQQINMPLAWDKEKGKDTVTVAVLDTGLANDHPDLVGRSVPGFNYVENNTDTYPPEDTAVADAGAVTHGTHIAGIIAANADDGIGVAGVCWQGVKIMPIRVADNTGAVFSDAVISGLDFALKNGANVVNMSFGGFAPSLAERSKIIELTNAGILCVAAAGNSGATFLPDVSFPAAYPECVAVASVGPTDKIAPYSSFGPDDEVDIAAPGGDSTFGQDAMIWSTTLSYESVTSGSTTTVVKNLDWGFLEGTSMAAPHVAGAAALLLSAGITPDQLRNELLTTARVPSTGYDPVKFGSGILDVGAALSTASVRIVKPARGSAVGARTEFKFALRKIDPTTVNVYLNFLDADGNGIPDDITMETPVITDVTPYLNADGSVADILWPIDGFSPLPKGSNNMYVTANSIFGDPVTPASTIFTVSSSVIHAGIRLASLPFVVNTSTVTPANILPGTTFTGTGGNPGRLIRWISVPRSLTDSTPIGYVTYSPSDPSDIVWKRPFYSLSSGLTVTTGGSTIVDFLLGPQFQPAIGSGYWLVVSADTAVSDTYPTLDSVTTWDRFKGCTITMYTGWNMFGNPYGHPIPWQSALFTYLGQTKTMQSASDAGWIRSVAFGFDSTQSSDYMRITDRDPLLPLSGYWVFSQVGTPTNPLQLILLP